MMNHQTCLGCGLSGFVNAPDDAVGNVRCNNCGNEQEFKIEPVNEVEVRRFLYAFIEHYLEHQNHQIGGILARQKFIADQGPDIEYSVKEYQKHLKYGDQLLNYAKQFLDENETDVDYGEMLNSLYNYADSMSGWRDAHYATCKIIARLKHTEVPESCKQDFCNDDVIVIERDEE
jgi:hypothetical protein